MPKVKLFSSVRGRLIGVYVGIVVLGFGGLTIWAARQLANATYDDFGRNLQVQTFILANQYVEAMEYGGRSLDNLARSAAESVNAEAALYNRSGNFLASSTGVSYPLLTSDTYTIQDGLIFASAPILDEDELLGYLQTVAPLTAAQTIVYQRWLGLGSGFVVVTALGFVVILWLLRTLIRPLTALQTTALKMADGDLSRRVEKLSSDEIGEVGRAFNEMAARVEAMVAEQRAFASNASHELRTPLTTVRLRTEALQDGGLDEETAAQYIIEIDQEVKHMARLVDDLLMLSRLDAKRLTAGQEQIDAVRLWQSLSDEYKPLAAEKSIEATYQLPSQPLLVTANLTHLRVVYRNVLDNAFKYTPADGQIKVTLQPNGRFAVLTITDSGRGIAAADLAHIGKRFFRADKAHSRQTQGVGLGLALVNSIVNLYAGEFEIHSSGLNRGTQVTIHWPLAQEGEMMPVG
ncbi:MAG: HAMP domain-containing histidine kinase [Anaerolineales bacterium]|nr:HAMP domain-containing histidine kinase [Anaerolineales bacterium]